MESPQVVGFGGMLIFRRYDIIKIMTSSYPGTHIPSYFEFIPRLFPSEFFGRLSNIDIKRNQIIMRRYNSDLRKFAKGHVNSCPFIIKEPKLRKAHWARVTIGVGIACLDILYLDWLNIINVDAKGQNVLIHIDPTLECDIDIVCIDHALSFFMTRDKVQTPYRVHTIESEYHTENQYVYSLETIIYRLCKEFMRLYKRTHKETFGTDPAETDTYVVLFNTLHKGASSSLTYIKYIYNKLKNLLSTYNIPGKYFSNKYKGLMCLFKGEDCSKYLPITAISLKNMKTIANITPAEIRLYDINNPIEYNKYIIDKTIARLDLTNPDKNKLCKYISCLMTIPSMTNNGKLYRANPKLNTLPNESSTSSSSSNSQHKVASDIEVDVDIKELHRLHNILSSNDQITILRTITAYACMYSIYNRNTPLTKTNPK